MKTFAALAFALSAVVAASTAQGQERPLFVYSGPVAIELPASLLASSAGQPSSATVSKDAPVRKVRIVLQSPYAN